MDVNDFRNFVTLLSFVLFAGIVKWAWSRRNQAGFNEAAQLPFIDEARAEPEPRGRATLAAATAQPTAEPRHE